jgi:hypothetical protein
MKRLSREGMVYPVPQPKDKPYLYMPNPTLIHPSSTRTNHFLGLVDFYIRIGQPEIYEVEPDLKHSYCPDAYTIVNGEPVIVELQLSHKSNKTIQEKINGFVSSYSIHKAKKMWLVTDRKFKYEVPRGFEVEVLPVIVVENKEGVG